MKKRIRLAALVAAATMLCGCSGGSAPPKQSDAGIAEVEAAIEAIGETITPESEAEVRLAEDLYYALSAKDRAKVANADALESAVGQFYEMKVDIDTIVDLIDAIGEVTLSKGNLIRQARTNYTGLDEGLRQYVTNYAKLTEAETAYEALTAQMAVVEMEEPYEYPEADEEVPADKDNDSENTEKEAPGETEPALEPEKDERTEPPEEAPPKPSLTPEPENLKVTVTSQTELIALAWRKNKKITKVVARKADISDLSPLSGLDNLTELRLEDNSIGNLSPLSNLTNLTALDLASNNISDLSPLSNLTNLAELDLYSNDISDINALSGLTNLTTLKLRSNNISDLSPLSNLTNLRWLYLSGNPLTQQQIDQLQAKLPNCDIDFD